MMGFSFSIARFSTSPMLVGLRLHHSRPFHTTVNAHNLFSQAHNRFSQTHNLFSQVHNLKLAQGSHFGMQTPIPRNYTCNAASDRSLALRGAELHELVVEVKGRLAKEHGNLPVGKNRRDDEDMILWFLKDRKLNVDDAVYKLVKTLTWREEFGVDNLTEEAVQNIASTGKAYLHDFPDVEGCPVVVVVAAKHFPSKHDLLESERLCVYLIEKALSQLQPGGEKILGIFDLRGFTLQNGDLTFIKFLIDVFYYYYPKRIGQVLFVDAPLIFQPGWNMVQPWLKSYANLVRFCSADVVREEYFTPETVPSDFRA